MTDRPIPRKPLLKKIGRFNLEQLYMGLREQGIFSFYPVMNFNEFCAFAAGAYQMKQDRPIRIEEMAVLPSLKQLVNTAHMQVLPGNVFALDSYNAAQQKVLDAANRGSEIDMLHHQQLQRMNPYSPKDLDARLLAFEKARPLTVAFLFEQMKKAPKTPYMWEALEPHERQEVITHPEIYHKIPYAPCTTRDKWKANQTITDFYAQEISALFERVSK